MWSDGRITNPTDRFLLKAQADSGFELWQSRNPIRSARRPGAQRIRSWWASSKYFKAFALSKLLRRGTGRAPKYLHRVRNFEQE